MAHSLAIITDAAHMLSDIAGFLVGVMSLFLTSRGANPDYSFGYHIAEVLGAMISIMIVWYEYVKTYIYLCLHICVYVCTCMSLGRQPRLLLRLPHRGAMSRP